MSDIKLFRLAGNSVAELDGQAVAVEKSLQTLMEGHLEDFLAVRFLATEYTTGKTHGGRIDTLGIDENGCPVIIEYKRSTNQNVINQGLFYLDWLLDHKAAFKLLVMEKYGPKTADDIEWSSPRLLCIAGDFTKYDEHAVQQMNRNIELIRYRRFGSQLLLLELVNAVSAAPNQPGPGPKKTKPPGSKAAKSIEDYIARADTELTDLYETLKEFLLNLGDDVQMKMLKWYVAFRRIKNFACVEVHPQKRQLVIYLRLDPSTVPAQKGFSRDVRRLGHYGTGDVEIIIRDANGFAKAKPLLLRAYEGG